MKKQIILLATLLNGAFIFAQVGINTETPQATFDVTGKPADTSILDGIIAPRITGVQLRAKTYTPTQTGALVYVTAADTAPQGQTIDVVSAGYYYFNGTKWVISGPQNNVNIYNANGSLSNGRLLNLNNFPLTYRGIQQETLWSASGSLSQFNNLSTGGQASINFFGGNNSNFSIQQFRNGDAQMLASDNAVRLLLGTSNTALPSDIRFDTSPGGNAGGLPRMFITPIGNLKIGENNTGTERLDVDGLARVRELPLNGSTNAHSTLGGDNLSPTKNQTFTGTRTVVADDNGVLGYVAGLPASPVNIYNSNGTLTSNRVATTGNNTLTFAGNSNSVLISNLGTEGRVAATGTGRGSFTASGGNSIIDFYADNNNFAQISARGTGNTGLSIRTEGATPVIFSTSNSERMRITPIGNLGINTNTPTERLHNNGNVRLQGLPLNGATNSIFTTSTGTASPTQNQTFTGTRTMVTDDNGVVGYITGVPATGPGSSKLIISASVPIPGTQDIGSSQGGGTINYSVENIDTDNALSGTFFTSPATGIYVISTQLSMKHVTTGATDGWFTVAVLQKSTDGGGTWNDLSRDTRSNNLAGDVDNGNILQWTGSLNTSDRVRVRVQCNANTANRVDLGTLTIQRLFQ